MSNIVLWQYVWEETIYFWGNKGIPTVIVEKQKEKTVVNRLFHITWLPTISKNIFIQLPRQSNKHDCGLYTIMYIEYILQNKKY